MEEQTTGTGTDAGTQVMTPGPPGADDDMRARAEERVDKKIRFKRHLVVYILVNAFLVVVWLLTAISTGDGAWFPWFIFPMVAWGIGLGTHAWSAYGDENRRGQLVNAEMEKMKQEQQK